MKQEEAFTKLLDEQKIDAFIIFDGHNIRFFSQFSGNDGCLLVTRTRRIVITDFRYIEQVNNEAKGWECFDISGKTYAEVLKEIFQKEGLRCIGFEDDTISYKQWNIIKQCCDVELIPINQEITKLRSVKSSLELANIARAEAIGDIAFSKILNIIKPGVTEKDVAMELEVLMKINGAEKLSFDTIVASGVNSSMPHALVTNKVIEKGDFVTMDFGCIYDGYCSDMTRTIVVGKASDEQKNIYNIVLEAQEAALDSIKAGLVCNDVDKIARDIISKAGYGPNFGHGLGHSVGLYIHEEPRFSPNCSTTLVENMVMTVEPGIYIPGFGGVRIEDLVVVKENGINNLTCSRKELIEL